LPRVHRLERFFLIAPLAAAAIVSHAFADETPQHQLQSVGQAAEQSRAREDAAQKSAAALAAEIAGLRARAIAGAAAVQAGERDLAAAQAKQAALAVDEAAKRAALARDGRYETALLAALLRVAAAPPEAVALAPAPPLDSLRGAWLVAHTVPPIEQRAAGLRHDIEAVAAAERDLAAAREASATRRQQLQGEEASLESLIAQKTALQAEASQTATDEGKRLVALAAQATSLHQLIDRLDAERRKEEEAQPPAGPDGTVNVTAPAPLKLDPTVPRHIRPFSEAHGAMVYPATGTLVLRFGAPDGFGAASQGLTFETAPAAVVVAPFDGQIVFAGPFRGYGQILIIAHGDGYHSLLAGLDRIDVSAGQALVAGEPVGRMPNGEGGPRLYFELRHDNQPINPVPWLATRLEKVNG
jgi:septal ring factor EnvC (AmiA/AmiB activator)